MRVRAAGDAPLKRPFRHGGPLPLGLVHLEPLSLRILHTVRPELRRPPLSVCRLPGRLDRLLQPANRRRPTRPAGPARAPARRPLGAAAVHLPEDVASARTARVRDTCGPPSRRRRRRWILPIRRPCTHKTPGLDQHAAAIGTAAEAGAPPGGLRHAPVLSRRTRDRGRVLKSAR